MVRTRQISESDLQLQIIFESYEEHLNKHCWFPVTQGTTAVFHVTTTGSLAVGPNNSHQRLVPSAGEQSGLFCLSPVLSHPKTHQVNAFHFDISKENVW